MDGNMADPHMHHPRVLAHHVERKSTVGMRIERENQYSSGSRIVVLLRFHSVMM